jgi:hypothetical protein
MWQGMFTKSTPFMRTPKMANKAAFTQGFLMASEESALMLAQWIAAIVVLLPKNNFYDPDVRLWSLVLVVQAMPFLAALITSLISVMPSKVSTDAPPAPTADPAKVQPAA